MALRSTMTRERTPDQMPTLFYDGDCRLCTRSVSVLGALGGEYRMNFVPIQHPNISQLCPDVHPDDLDREIHLLIPGKGVFRGYEATARAIGVIPWLKLLERFMMIPWVVKAGKRIYRSVAQHYH